MTHTLKGTFLAMILFVNLKIIVPMLIISYIHILASWKLIKCILKLSYDVMLCVFLICIEIVKIMLETVILAVKPLIWSVIK